ncbi:enoyl-CoA hydratase-related protein [soil metagenome]
MPNYQYAVVERDGPITIVTINRPEALNALHNEAHAELGEIFDGFAADPDQWVAIITGAGERAFCAGNDLKVTAAGGSLTMGPPAGFAGLTSRLDLTKPVIAAVNGVAMGGGFETALACDIIVASEKALFALPEPRVGLAALGGGLHRLSRSIGEKRALDLILTSRRVGAQEGLQLGFVNYIAPPEGLMAEARRVAAEICLAGPLSVRASKEAVLRGVDMTLEDALAGQLEFPAIKALFASQDFLEGPRAFAEKRSPQWIGA